MGTNEPIQSAKSSDCEQIQLLIPAYAIGAVDEEERLLVESGLAECAELQTELESYQALHDGLLMSAPSTEAPSHLLNSILEATASSVVTRPKKRKNTPRYRWWSYAVAAITIVLLVVTNAYWLQTTQGLQKDINELRYENQHLIQQLEPSTELLLALGSFDENRIELQSDDNSSARLAWVTDNSGDAWVAWFSTSDLPALESDYVYQLWLIHDGDPMNVGIFEVDSYGKGTLAFVSNEPLRQYEWIGITVEPEGGSRLPTSDPILGSDI